MSFEFSRAVRYCANRPLGHANAQREFLIRNNCPLFASNAYVAFSPDGLMLASVLEDKIAVRHVSDLKLVALFNTSVPVEPNTSLILSWSFDSSMVMLYSPHMVRWFMELPTLGRLGDPLTDR